MNKFLLLSLLITTTSFAATIIPFEREISRLPRASFILSNNETSHYFTNEYLGDEDENLFFEGFGFQNNGPNEVVTTSPEGFDFPHRIFSFVSSDKSRRDNYLWVTDYNGSGRVSDYFETMLVFLPRENLIHVEESGDDILVTLNTGEEVFFSKEHKTMRSGVLAEAPMDMNPDRDLRKHAQINYSGKGIMIRSDARGADPRLVPNVQVIRKGLSPCKVPAKVFWTQEDFPKFKFVTDEEAYAVITKHCGAKFLHR
jgi:hypothetical protein